MAALRGPLIGTRCGRRSTRPQRIPSACSSSSHRDNGATEGLTTYRRRKQVKEGFNISFVQWLFSHRPEVDATLTYAQMLEYLQNKRATKVLIYDDGKTAIVEVCIPGYEEEPPHKMETQRFEVPLPADYERTVLPLVKAANTKRARPETGNVPCSLYVMDPRREVHPILGQLVSWMVPIGLFWIFQKGLELFEWFRRKGRSKRSQMKQAADEFGKSTAIETRGRGRSNTGVLFEDVAGVDWAVAEFQSIVSMLLGDAKYDKLGAKLPKGILLEGAPGTGKTMLAKAVASEGGLPFFSANGSEFVEMFIGVAAARIRDLFRRARDAQPSIVFVDEIDTIGRSRGGDEGDPSRKEREQGLLQLLTEMDGVVGKDDRILVIAATNMKEKLDEALLRSGRFDRNLRLDLPDEQGRLEILRVHSRGKMISHEGDEQFSDDAILRRAAQLTVGFSGAELANVMNEAAIMSVRREKSEITLEDMEAAMDKQRTGLLRPPLPNTEYKKHLATMQAGRAVAASLNKHVSSGILQVSVQPKGEQSSRLLTMPMGRDGLAKHQSFEDHLDMLAVMLSGRMTEETLLGEESASTLTSAEVIQATRAASQIASETGLVEEMNLLAMPEEMAPYFPLFQQQLSHSVRMLLEEASFRSKCLIHCRLKAIETLRDQLLEEDSLSGSDVEKVVASSEVVEVPSSWISEHEQKMEDIRQNMPAEDDFTETSFQELARVPTHSPGHVGKYSYGKDRGKPGYVFFSSSGAQIGMLMQGHWSWLPGEYALDLLEGDQHTESVEQTASATPDSSVTLQT